MQGHAVGNLLSIHKIIKGQ